MIEAMWRALKVLENKKLRMDEHLIPIVVDDLRQAIKAAENPDEPPDYVEPVTTDYHEGWEEGFKAGNALAPTKREQWDTSDMAYRPNGLTIDDDIQEYKKPWVGLTDDEIHETAIICVKSGQSVNAAIRAIEAKLKERNNG
jgi:hypothetical protein